MRRATCDSNGLTLSYLDWPAQGGSPDAGDLILLLHGFLDVGHSMVPLVRALRERGVGARLVAPDWRGHGDSGWVGAGGYYHFPDYVADLANLVDHLAPGPLAEGRHVFVVGHSMGGTASSYYAGTFPERLSGLVNVEGLGPPVDGMQNAPMRTRAWTESWRRAVARRQQRPPLASVEEALEKLRKTSPELDGTFGRELAVEATRSDGPGGLQWKFDPLHQTPGAMPFNLEQAQAYWRNVSVPVLLIEATASPWHLLPDLPERRACFARRSCRLIEGAGHMVHHERPAELATLIAGFTGAVRTEQFSPDP